MKTALSILDDLFDQVVVCMLTSHPAPAKVPGNTLLPKQRTGLQQDSAANTS
jgi:hypothetical protein